MKTYTKLAALIWLCFHNCIHNLLIRYSRVRNVEKMYFSSVAVFFTEIVKLLLCFIVIFFEEGGLFKFFCAIRKQVVGQPWDTLKVCIPSLLYTIQNNLLFAAASHLEAAIFAVVCQLKIFPAASFSVIILERRLSRAQWLSFIVLFSGVTLIQFENNISPRSFRNNRAQSPIFGFYIACLACVISGFAGVLLEKIYKDSAPVTIWMRNAQMSVFTIPASFAGILIQDYNEIFNHGFLFGFDLVVWMTIFWYGIGGLSVAVCLKYADNISKDFATSLAIILSTIGSIYIFDFVPNPEFILGAILVILSIFLYSSSKSLLCKYFYTNLKNNRCFSVKNISFPL